MIKEKLKEFIRSYNKEANSLQVPKILMLIWELQLASLFISSIDQQKFDSSLLQTLSHINFSYIWDKLAFPQATLVYTLLGFYTVLFGMQIYTILRRCSSFKTEFDKAYEIIWMVQRYVVLIPSLCQAIYALNSPALVAAKAASGVLVALVALVNIIPNELKIELPFEENFINKNQERLNLIFAVIAICSRQIYLIAGLHGKIPVGFYIVLQILAFFRILLNLINPYFTDDFTEVFNQLIPLLPQYVLFSEGYLTFSSTMMIPWLLILPFACKLILHARRMLLKLSVLNLRNGVNPHQNPNFINWAIKNFLFRYKNVKYIESLLFLEIGGHILDSNLLNYEGIIDVQKTLDLPSNVEGLSLPSLRTILLQYIESFYKELLGTSKGRDSFEIRLSKIQFLVYYAEKPLQALIEINETRKAMHYQIGSMREIALDLIQVRAIKFLQNSELESSELNLNEFFDIVEHFSQTRVRVLNVTKEKIAMLHTLGEPICDIDKVRRQANKITLESEALLTVFQQAFEKRCYLLNDLYQHFHSCVLEGSKETRLHRRIVEKRREQFDIDVKLDQEMLLNIDTESQLSLAVFSLNDSNFGELTASSPNFLKDLGITAEQNTKILSIGSLYPRTYASYYKEVMTQMVQGKFSFHSESWNTSFLYKSDGALMETKLQIKIDFYKENISAVFYHLKIQDSQPFIIYDQPSARGCEVIGVSESTFEVIGRKIPGAFKALKSSIVCNYPFEMNRILTGYQHDQNLSDEKGFNMIQKVGRMSMGSLVSKSCFKVDGTSQKSLDKERLSFPIRYTVEPLNIGDSEFNQICFRINILGFYDPKGSVAESLTQTNRTPLLTVEKVPTESISKLKLIGRQENSTEDGEYETTNQIEKGDSPKMGDSPFTPKRILFSKMSSASKDNAVRGDSQFSTNKQEDKILRFSKLSASSKQSNKSARRGQVKALVSRLGVPPALKFANYLGHFVVAGLVLMVTISFIIFNDGFNKFAQYANVAPFPSYFTSVMKSVYGVTEIDVLTNQGAFPPDTASLMLGLGSSLYSDRVRRFMSKYSTFMINYDVEELSPNFHYRDFEILMRRDGVFQQATNISVHEASLILLGVLVKLYNSDLSTLHGNTSEVIWLREYTPDLISTYNKMKSAIYSDFYSHQRKLLHMFDETLYVAVVLSLGMVFLVTVVLKKVEGKEINLLKNLATISSNLIAMCLEEIRTDLLEARICSQGEMEKMGLWIDKTKISSKKTIRTFKKKTRSLTKILIGSLTCVLYVISFYLFTNIYYKKQTSYTAPLIANIELFSDAVPYAGWSTGFVAQIMSNMNNSDVQEEIEFYSGIMDDFKNMSQRIAQATQNFNATMLTNPYVSDLIKERYVNISTIRACNDLAGTVNYNGCLTSFKGEAQFGFSAIYSRCYEYSAALWDLFLRNFTYENMLALSSDPRQKDRIYFAIAADPILVNNVELEGVNLSNAMSTIKRNLIAYLVVGLVVMSSVLFLIWRPLYQMLVAEALNNKKIFKVLPIKLIEENAYLKTALKRQINKV